jgi:YegS/Rv2252/BmrU family lipid kinase
VRAEIIFNPTAGRGRAAAIASTVQKSLAKRGLDTQLHVTEKSGDATTLACAFAGNADIVVAVGGDGTVNEIANGLACSPTSLGIVPAGTVNVLALELGLPFQVERACNVIAEGRTIAMDLGKANGRRFVLMTGIGVDALTVRNVDPRAKRMFRELAFLSTGLRLGFTTHPTPFLVRANGEEHTAIFAVIGNSRYYAGRLGMTSSADPTDGVLDLIMFTGRSRAALASFWLGVPSGLHMRHPETVYVLTEKAEITPIEKEDVVWFQTDGELAGRIPVTVDVEPHALNVLVP